MVEFSWFLIVSLYTFTNTLFISPYKSNTYIVLKTNNFIALAELNPSNLQELLKYKRQLLWNQPLEAESCSQVFPCRKHLLYPLGRSHSQSGRGSEEENFLSLSYRLSNPGCLLTVQIKPYLIQDEVYLVDNAAHRRRQIKFIFGSPDY